MSVLPGLALRQDTPVFRNAWFRAPRSSLPGSWTPNTAAVLAAPILPLGDFFRGVFSKRLYFHAHPLAETAGVAGAVSDPCERAR